MRAVLLYPCNLIGYSRLILIMSAIWVLMGDPEIPWIVLGCLCASLLLDVFDGYLARRFGHTTTFGTLLDLALDLTTHTILWVASDWPFAVVLIGIEWTAGVMAMLITISSDQNWKHRVSTTNYRLIHYYFSCHQRNWLSAYSNMAHFLFPAALFIDILNPWFFALTIPGLIIYELVTLTMIVLLGFREHKNLWGGLS